jgi:hypothetical protein
MTIFDGIAWVYWLVGTLGLAGTIAAFWFFPVVAMSVAKFLATFLFTTRIGNIILAAGLAFMIADINRSQRDAAEYAEQTAADDGRLEPRASSATPRSPKTRARPSWPSSPAPALPKLNPIPT